MSESNVKSNFHEESEQNILTHTVSNAAKKIFVQFIKQVTICPFRDECF